MHWAWVKDVEEFSSWNHRNLCRFIRKVQFHCVNKNKQANQQTKNKYRIVSLVKNKTNKQTKANVYVIKLSNDHETVNFKVLIHAIQFSC